MARESCLLPSSPIYVHWRKSRWAGSCWGPPFGGQSTDLSGWRREERSLQIKPSNLPQRAKGRKAACQPALGHTVAGVLLVPLPREGLLPAKSVAKQDLGPGLLTPHHATPLRGTQFRAGSGRKGAPEAGNMGQVPAGRKAPGAEGRGRWGQAAAGNQGGHLSRERDGWVGPLASSSCLLSVGLASLGRPHME